MTDYNTTVARRLAQVYTSAVIDDGRELADLRVIIFSDLHKGRGDRADDFRFCHQTYLAALEHYWRDSFEIFLLGDVEELWENRPGPVIRHYGDVLNQELLFAQSASPGRYARFVGNHDDQWYDSGQVQQHLGSYLAGQPVIESLRMEIHDQGQPLGELMFLHGHQGTPDSERFARWSALVVRYVWRPIQRAFNIPSNTPSNNYELRQKHELAMYSFAASRPRLVLFAGHTHHPVWEGLSFEQAMQQMPMQVMAAGVDPAWVADQVAEAVTLPGRKPSYFNSGCCSYSDGSITGIEIADGEIRLVRWTVGAAQPVRALLFSAALRDVLAAVAD
jgi:UDP-2,3-diacylglucosamine pyrophosphatase LpxH